MKARFLGHAAVLLESEDGTSLLIDPYNPGGFGGKMAYRPIAYEADAVVCSHQHADHCALKPLRNSPHLINGDASYGPFAVRRHRAFHDEYGGRRRGGAVDVLEIRVDGLRVVHLSDVGHSPPAGLVEALKRPDWLFVPVGGFFTVGAAQAHEWWRRLAARHVVPVHYRTDRCGLTIRPRAHFEAYLHAGAHAEDSCVELRSRMVSFDSSVVLLDPEC